MSVTIFFMDGTRTTIHHVDNITWSRQNIYIDVLQTWNESPATDEPYIYRRENIFSIKINNI